jgi:hypothetical protein
MDREIKLLRDKVQDLSQENVALREINVQFQLENFKLQQKIKSFESSQICLGEPNVSVVTFNDGNFDGTAEYLEEDHLDSSHKLTKSKIDRKQRISRPTKRTYQDSNLDDEFDDECPNSEDKLNIKQEIIIEDTRIDEDYIPEPQLNDIDGLETDDVNPKDAATIVYRLAAQRGQLEKLKSLEPGKHKDASFVNKTLDLFFTKTLLANSSARGQKCQTRPNVPLRPALDAKKINICRQAFIYRLKREGLPFSAREDRLKSFFAYVNFKIQNSRKMMQKKNIKLDGSDLA